jgi:hypothetical protein
MLEILLHPHTGNIYALASCGFPPVLAVEIETRTPPSAQRLPDGPGESDLGPGAHGERTLAEARPAGVSENRTKTHTNHTCRMFIHDRDAIFSKQVDQGIRNMGLHVLKTLVQTPVANAMCERVIGSLRRECLDFMIPLNREASIPHFAGRGGPLQRRPTSYGTRAGHSTAKTGIASDTPSISTSDSNESTCGGSLCLGRPAP